MNEDDEKEHTLYFNITCKHFFECHSYEAPSSLKYPFFPHNLIGCPFSTENADECGFYKDITAYKKFESDLRKCK